MKVHISVHVPIWCPATKQEFTEVHSEVVDLSTKLDVVLKQLRVDYGDWATIVFEVLPLSGG